MTLNTERLVELRDRMRLTNRRISAELGINENTVGRWVRGETQPNSLHLSQLAETLETSVDYLLGNTDDPTPAQGKKYELSSAEYRLVEAYRRGDWKRLMRLLGNED